MRLHPLFFNNTEDVERLLNRLDLTTKDVNLLAQTFLVASDGNTYLLDDISHLSPMDIDSSRVIFPTKNGNTLTVADIKLALENNDQHLLDTLVHNKPLADMLVNKRLPTPSYLDLFSIVFPLISYQERTFEEHGIEEYLARCRAKLKPQIDPLNHQALTRDHLKFNIALAQLIHVTIAALHEVKIYQEKTFKLRKPSLALRQLLEKYETSLLEKEQYYQEKLNSSLDGQRLLIKLQPQLLDKLHLSNTEHIDKNILNAMIEQQTTYQNRWNTPYQIGHVVKHPHYFRAALTLYILEILALVAGGIHTFVIPGSGMSFNVVLYVLSTIAIGSISPVIMIKITEMLEQIEKTSLAKIQQAENIIDTCKSLLNLSEEKEYLNDFIINHSARISSIQTQLKMLTHGNHKDDIDNTLERLTGDTLNPTISLDEKPLKISRHDDNNDIEKQEEKPLSQPGRWARLFTTNLIKTTANASKTTRCLRK